jgi:hypothetical protein
MKGGKMKTYIIFVGILCAICLVYFYDYNKKHKAENNEIINTEDLGTVIEQKEYFERLLYTAEDIESKEKVIYFLKLSDFTNIQEEKNSITFVIPKKLKMFNNSDSFKGKLIMNNKGRVEKVIIYPEK